MLTLVGQAPSKRTDGLDAFAGRSGRRLASLLGLQFEELGRRVDLRNVFDDYPGQRNGKGDAFPTPAARERAARLAASLVGRRVVLCGYAVAAAFGLAHIPPLAWFSIGGVTVAKIPHPSGVNTFYNDARNVARVAAFLREALEEEEIRCRWQMRAETAKRSTASSPATSGRLTTR